MVTFHTFQHVERFLSTETENITNGLCYVFPKIDGTCGSIWYDDEENIIYTASRKKILNESSDNRGFRKYVTNNLKIYNFFCKHYGQYILYGEWLVPHSLKTYNDDAWDKFYIFDVVNNENNKYMPYDEYKLILNEFDMDYIKPLATILNPSNEALYDLLSKNTFLIKENMGVGEGIVIKNYEYKNKYGRTTYAKIIADEFKEKRKKKKEKKEQFDTIENKLVLQYCTASLIEKTYAKIIGDEGGWSSKLIPRLLNTVYHDLVIEEIWNFVKENKNPTINFKEVQRLVNIKIKEYKSDLF